jgi:hypothetical protein
MIGRIKSELILFGIGSLFFIKTVFLKLFFWEHLRQRRTKEHQTKNLPVHPIL